MPESNYLVRYGTIPEVARCRFEDDVPRGTDVVVETHRGLLVGSILEAMSTRALPAGGTTAAADDANVFRIVRPVTDVDRQRQRELRDEADREFQQWTERIREWNIDVQLIDLEWTLDRSRLVLYVLNDRGPECTKLALQAAAAGLGVIEVQPVTKDGLAPPAEAKSKGCGSGGCGCHH